MVNGLAVLGWGVGGIEAEAAMLGQPQSMLLPEVIGFKLTGKLTEGVTATDLVLTVTQMLRKKGVVGKFVEFYGPGLDTMPLADRATIANMAPEYGATCGFFPVDAETLTYLDMSGRESIAHRARRGLRQGAGHVPHNGSPDPVFTDTLELDLATVVPSLAGPKRPEGRIALPDVATGFAKALETEYKKPGELAERVPVEGRDFDIGHGDVVIAAITSCTNTSNPSVLIAAGLLAKKAVEKGLTRKPWVKTSLAPGSQVVSAYLDKAGLQPYLDKLGFNLVGFGCTTCIGNSGPLAPEISAAINENGVVAAAVLSGNRNFEGRISPDVQANYLASPPLVVAYALAGTVQKDLTKEPLGTGSDGQPVFLKDIWPTSQEIQKFIAENDHARAVPRALRRRVQRRRELARDRYGRRRDLHVGRRVDLRAQPALLRGHQHSARPPSPTSSARASSGCSATRSPPTTSRRPAPSSRPRPPAHTCLEHDVAVADFNQYGTRRGNHEVMMRGTFANIRIKNFMARDAAGNVKEGGLTVHYPSGEQMSIFDAAMRYKRSACRSSSSPASSTATAPRATGRPRARACSGVQAVIAQSFERIHRSNLVGMGIVPFVFEEGTSWQSLGLKGDEIVNIPGLTNIQPRQMMTAEITAADGTVREVPIRCRIDTLDELEYFKNGGILHYVLRNLAAA